MVHNSIIKLKEVKMIRLLQDWPAIIDTITEAFAWRGPSLTSTSLQCTRLKLSISPKEVKIVNSQEINNKHF